ncbi:MAG: pyridoxine 5'-phosphate synthase [Verrucomicrobia bacterium]|nr:pyridoxine 5'-phosphate synthase [Verrucomicrobiota bacterium]MBU4291383.1 pyridoxine 5'-phosphate synthase [Verrucomicrobiota bacterium]MBU4497426.1 pyridoxine 5'-phosphate synthase [Verrucomicrobiota bacterium]MCG2680081.1 pyridoxine 5'-phosphate synthase [Kiritimatiellia bacterium]
MKYRQLKLGVNVDHVATVRQARGTPYPDPLEAARLCEKAGAAGITIHLREDRRHIQDRDLWSMRRHLNVRLNLEMANTPDIVAIAVKARPDEVCLVPEKRRELTTEGGLDADGQKNALKTTLARLAGAGIVASLFIDPERRQLEAAAELGAPYVELHTGSFCDASGRRAQRELKRLIVAAHYAHELGLNVNAGHGINLATIGNVLQIPWLDTLNIGHSIIARAVLVGMKSAVREMLAAMRGYRGYPRG